MGAPRAHQLSRLVEHAMEENGVAIPHQFWPRFGSPAAQIVGRPFRWAHLPPIDKMPTEANCENRKAHEQCFKVWGLRMVGCLEWWRGMGHEYESTGESPNVAAFTNPVATQKK